MLHSACSWGERACRRRPRGDHCHLRGLSAGRKIDDCFRLNCEDHMFDNIRADMKTYESIGGWFRAAGFWVTATYRLGRWARAIRNPVARLLLSFVYGLLSRPMSFVRGVEISARTKIGPGLSLPHPHGIFISGDAELGARCTIFQGVTIGHGAVDGVPKLGDDVAVFAGAKVLGGIRIGDDVEIGANAVVVRDIESHSIVSAPASRAIPRETINQLREGRSRHQSPL